MEPTEIWMTAADRVRQEIADPTVWLAMRAAQPLVIDGSFFVAALPPQEEYLAVHLLNHQTTTAIEDALEEAAGRILAFRLVIGTSVTAWEAEKAREAGEAAAPASDPFLDVPIVPPSSETVHASPRTAPAEAAREVTPTWEKLSERLSHGYKTAPFVKYPHGQAQFVLTAVKIISDTMDAQMPPPGAPRDEYQERQLAKIVERLSGIINLDPLFISLELLRYREMHGKNGDITI